MKPEKRTALFWVITQRVVVILDPWRWSRQVVPKRRWGITTTCCVMTQQSAVLICFAAEAWNHEYETCCTSLFKVRGRECLAEAVVPGRSIPLQNSGFVPRPVHVGFVVDEVAVGQVFLRVLSFHLRDSAVGIATLYGLEVWGSNPGGGEIFRTRPNRSWGPPSLPIQWVPGISRG